MLDPINTVLSTIDTVSETINKVSNTIDTVSDANDSVSVNGGPVTTLIITDRNTNDAVLDSGNSVLDSGNAVSESCNTVSDSGDAVLKTYGPVHYVFRSIVALNSLKLKLYSVKYIVQCRTLVMQCLKH